MEKSGHFYVANNEAEENKRAKRYIYVCGIRTQIRSGLTIVPRLFLQLAEPT